MKPRVPDWYWAVLVLLLILGGAFAAYYSMGASGVRIGGAEVSFGREHDMQMFRVDDEAALLVSSSDSVALVRYAAGMFPFCPICGDVEPTGSIVTVVSHQDGSHFYVDRPLPRTGELHDLETGETIEVAAPGARSDDTFTGAEAPFRERRLRFDPPSAMTPERAAREHEPLRVINESCTIIVAAFSILLVGWLSVGLVLLVRPRRAAE